MTEWRNWACWRRVYAAAFDRTSGAATVGESAARALAELVETVADLSPEDLREAVGDALDHLLAHQSVMAPITNLANLTYLTLPEGPEEVSRSLEELADRLARSTERIGRAGAQVIPQRSTVLTHSSSTSVRAVFLTARRTRPFRVCCTESLPEGEGVMMAADLAAAGFEVEVIPDDAVVETLPGIDLVLVGADAVGPTGAINRVGTLVLARECQRLGIPFYLVASREKVLPDVLFQRATEADGRDEFFEVIPFSQVRAVVTEDGPLPPEEAGRHGVGRPVAPELLRSTDPR